MIQVNELCHELAYRGMSEERRRKLSWAENTSINMGSGLTAGVAAAILSQVRYSLPHISFDMNLYAARGHTSLANQQGTRT